MTGNHQAIQASQDAVRTQARFEELNMDYFRISMGLMEKCLRDSGIDKRDVHDVVLVGSERVAKYQ